MPRRDPIADANQTIRDLRNQLHNYDAQVAIPLRTKVAELERANAQLALRVERAEGLHGLYRDAWEASIRLFNGVLASGKR
jgi:hypothetical protein